MRLLPFGCLALIALLQPAAAQLRADRDAEDCVVGTGNASLDIAICGRALGDPGLPALDRASVHVARGKALRAMQRHPDAMAEFDAALALLPLSASAYHERAVTRVLIGDYRAAVPDFDRALDLSPRFADARKHRGLAHFFAGSLECAATDLRAAEALAPSDAEVPAFRGFIAYLDGRYSEAAGAFARVDALHLPYDYLPLWRYLAEARAGLPARPGLETAARALAADEWPAPLMAVYLGDAGRDTLLAADSTRGHRDAEARVYVALLDGSPDPGLLRDAFPDLIPRSPERVVAEHLLARAGIRRPLPDSRGCPPADA